MILDFDSLLSPDLAEDYFDDVLRDVAKNEPKIMYIENIGDTLSKPVSNLVAFDFLNDTVNVGYKLPQDQQYDVISDTVPTETVFDWAKGFFDGKVKEFPNVPKFKPIVPQSRYEANVGISMVEDKFISAGFRIYRPTIGQSCRLATYCDNEMKETYLLSVPAYPFRHPFPTSCVRIGINEATTFLVREEGVRKGDGKILRRELNKLRDRDKGKNNYYKEARDSTKIFYIDETISSIYMHLGEAVVFNKSGMNFYLPRLQKAVGFSLKFVTVGHHLVLNLSATEKVSIEKMMAKEERLSKLALQPVWYSEAKYYTRYYNSVISEKTTALLCGLDFNPYSPYALDQLQYVTIGRDSIDYARDHKGEEVKGRFNITSKRYHSDVWFASMFSIHTPYTRDLMSCDLATNQYRLEKSLKLVSRFDMLGVPLMVEPYAVREDKRKYCGPRSMLRYKDSTSFSITHVPYMSASVRVSNYQMTDLEVINWNGPIVIRYRNGTTSEYYQEATKVGQETIADFLRWFKNVKKSGVDNLEDYNSIMDQYKQYFVLELNEYVHTKKVTNKKKNVHKDTDLTVPRYRVWKIPIGERENREKKVKCFFVPYCIRRYPHNNLGSLIGDLAYLTLEESIRDISFIKDMIKDPPWLFGALKVPQLIQCDELEFDDDYH